MLITACSGGGSKSKGASPTGAAPTTTTSAPPTPNEVAQNFLNAWAAGDWAKAGSYTDSPDKASARLQSVMTSLGSPKMTVTLGSATSAPPPSAPDSSPATPSAGSSASASASASAPAAPAQLGGYLFDVSDDFGNSIVWPYKSVLNMVQGADGTPLVHWASSVINPSLGPAATLKAVPPKQSVTDSAGTPLSGSTHPSLAAALGVLATKLPAGATPTALTIEFADLNTGAQISGSTSYPLGNDAATPTTLKTTIKSSVQSAMENALKNYPNAGMVAIQPSTGDILGMASNPAGSLAYKATRAPGSTFKVITTALALQHGLKTTDPVQCTPTATVEGSVINNDSSLKNGLPGAKLKDAFEQSCNTAFVNLAMGGKLGSDYSALATEAHDYFGLNQKWDLGLGAATYGTVGGQQVPPADGQGLFARDAFGQGNISMSPLVMASVAATVCAGQFHQPVLVPGTQTVSATALPGDVDSQLTVLMQGVITSGTAAGVFPGMPGLAGKTGSAESNDTPKTGKTDSWMIVFDKQHDIAFGALVLNGGFGRDKAGPAIYQTLKALGY